MELLEGEQDQMLLMLPSILSDCGQTFTISGIKETSALYLDAVEMKVQHGLNMS